MPTIKMSVKKQVKKSATVHGVRVDYYLSSGWRADRNLKTRKNRLKMRQALEREKARRSNCFSSVSHTLHLGGFALTSKPVGFDLEPAGRHISSQAIARFTTKTELASFDHNALAIWVAKEAAFKSLRGIRQPKTITAIEVKAYRRAKQYNKNSCTILYQFTLNQSRHLTPTGFGRCEISERTILGIAVPTP